MADLDELKEKIQSATPSKTQTDINDEIEKMTPILEPFKEFPNLFEKNTKNAEEYFDELIKKSKIDTDENIKTADLYMKTLNEYNRAKEKLSSLKLGRTWLWILFSLLLLTTVILIFSMADGSLDNYALYISLSVIFVAGAITDVVLIFKKLNPRIEESEKYMNEKAAEAEKYHATCLSQMYPLNSLYDWNMPSDVIKKTTPLIQLDKNFDVKKYQYMVDKYKLKLEFGKKTSVVFVQSGSVVGNPFLIQRLYTQTDGTKVYTGSIIISWTTTYTDSDGNTHTQTHTQTLYASVEKPCPYYHYYTSLIYSNDAAPKLQFSRDPQVKIYDSDKKIERTVKRTSKQIDKLADKALTDNDPSTNFTAMGNNEFDSLFHAFDRNDEVEFRLLFTPLAQKNELSLIKSKEPYGDDFTFIKNKKINTIISEHAQGADLDANPSQFISYDVRIAKKSFVDYTNAYFKGLFFDLAPLISIPLYQQTKPKEYIYKEEYQTNVSFLEQEVMANKFDRRLVEPIGAGTDSILKTSFTKKDGAFDQVNINASAFRCIDRTDYKRVLGGDGLFHTIPIPWVEYIPIKNDTIMCVENCDSSRYTFNSMMKNQGFQNFVSRVTKGNTTNYERGLFAFLLSSPEDILKSDVETLKSLEKPKEKDEEKI